MFEEQENNFLKLSNPQLDMFSSKLVDLAEVQDMAHAGEDMKPFIALFTLNAPRPRETKILIPYLKKLGFKP